MYKITPAVGRRGTGFFFRFNVRKVLDIIWPACSYGDDFESYAVTEMDAFNRQSDTFTGNGVSRVNFVGLVGRDDFEDYPVTDTPAIVGGKYWNGFAVINGQQATSGTLWLSCDGQYYSVTLYTDSGVVTTNVEQTASSGTPNSNYIVLASDNGQNYKVSLVNDNGVIALSVEQTSTAEAAQSISLISTDSQLYSVGLTTDNGVTTIKITQ